LVQLVEAETGRLVASLDDPQQSRSRQAIFSADGSRLILTSEDSRAAHVWDLRAIRHELVAMGLDWDWPPLPEPDVTATAAGPLRVATDLGGHDFSWGGSYPQELDRLNEALEIDSGDLYTMVRRGRVYIGMGRYDQAMADFARALTIRPGDPRILAARGEAYLWKKQYASGFADCEASLAALPDQASIQNSLAWAYATAPPSLRDSAKAVTHAQSAVRLAPEVGNYHNTLGVALYRAGEFRESVIELDTSLATASRQDTTFNLFFLAMCHFQLGETDRAKVDFDRACRLQSEAPPAAANADDLQAIRREAEALVTGSTPP
jgi:Tfp pilus assembly protein PilF